ncbi:28S ribosomal protein S10, mitochondrial isoform X2 [Monodelphis domestica]|uniref:28S ribosomal protein S10, mitochondrial isoform X2 n=1 Tax=Monodelphis domestica TaxID=13616 RepID=UPI0024E25070|nr:28S ribosomal protein S10, mitochondrial isoform X2 [Monodelphis domestica]
MRRCLSIREWLNKLWYMMVMEYYCAIRNDEQDDFYVNWEKLNELMQSEMSRTRKTLYTISISDEPDTLYKHLSVLVKGHDKAVLDSYEYFAVLAAKELGISIKKVHEPPRKIERLTLLKSVHIFKKHRVQYEMRTYYRCLELEHLTGSTADVYLEYIQRNLPEGVAMEVTKTRLEQLPEHIKEPLWEMLGEEEKASKA